MSSKVSLGLVDLLAENPYWTINGVAERLGVAQLREQRAEARRLDEAITANLACLGFPGVEP